MVSEMREVSGLDRPYFILAMSARAPFAASESFALHSRVQQTTSQASGSLDRGPLAQILLLLKHHSQLERQGIDSALLRTVRAAQGQGKSRKPCPDNIGKMTDSVNQSATLSPALESALLIREGDPTGPQMGMWLIHCPDRTLAVLTC